MTAGKAPVGRCGMIQSLQVQQTRGGRTLMAHASHLPLRRRILATLAAGVGLTLIAPAVFAASAAELSRDSQASLKKLYANIPAAKAIGSKAKAVLVFPKITKAGLGVGGQYGDGALIQGGKVVGYYNTTGVSSGLQAGAQTYRYAMFFMNDAALKSLDRAGGFEVGVGPTIVVMDEGKAKTMNTTTATEDVYVFIFSQKGVMGGLGIQGNKITKISPK
jgi:lipid-binding SYLF domain-containing protein